MTVIENATFDQIQVGDIIATTGGRRCGRVSGTVTKVNRATIVVETEVWGNPITMKLRAENLDGELRIGRKE